MSCAFGQVIYGWAWTEEVEQALRNLYPEELEEFGIYPETPEELEDWKFSDDNAQAFGFKTFYNASGNEVSGYLGVKLDDINVYVPTLMSDFKIVPTEEQKAQVIAKLKNLPKVLWMAFGEPKVWVVWGDT